MPAVNIFWFRRDLRLDDNAGLFHALKSGIPVVPIFVFDSAILDKLDNKTDRRVEFIHKELENIQEKLVAMGSSLEVYHSAPADTFKRLLTKYTINSVFYNQDYEPYARERDAAIAGLLKSEGIPFHSYKDQVIFEKDEVIKDNGEPYTVFTPYNRKWKSLITESQLRSYQVEKYYDNFYKQERQDIPSLRSIGFSVAPISFPPKSLPADLLARYQQERNFPGIASTSKLGVHLRFGTLSCRALAVKASELSTTFLNELIWRDFYHMILWNFPEVGKGRSFKPQYDNIEWRQDSGEFERWCNGQTGYPIVDAGMRELNATGFMHNRVRMIVASFLVKHLLLDWRLGEAYFAEKLLDFDLAANNGGWQWAAGSGCDAAPYFRIFNPYLQTKKFDPNLEYIKKWVPEFQEFHYPTPIIEHEVARKRCLEVYANGLRKVGF